MAVLFLSRKDVKECFTMDDPLDGIEKAFNELIMDTEQGLIEASQRALQ